VRAGWPAIRGRLLLSRDALKVSERQSLAWPMLLFYSHQK
jgi:hypothetical protein